MSRLLSVFLAAIAGAALAYAGFYLTGLLVGHTNPASIGLSAQALYAPLMFCAWGLPAGLAWFLVGATISRDQIRLSILGACVEVLILLALAMGESSVGSFWQELYAWVKSLVMPIAFIAVLSPAGALLGQKFRSRKA